MHHRKGSKTDFKSICVTVEDFEIAVMYLIVLFLLRALGSTRCRHSTSTHVVKRVVASGRLFLKGYDVHMHEKRGFHSNHFPDFLPVDRLLNNSKRNNWIVFDYIGLCNDDGVSSR